MSFQSSGRVMTWCKPEPKIFRYWKPKLWSDRLNKETRCLWRNKYQPTQRLPRTCVDDVFGPQSEHRDVDGKKPTTNLHNCMPIAKQPTRLWHSLKRQPGLGRQSKTRQHAWALSEGAAVLLGCPDHAIVLHEACECWLTNQGRLQLCCWPQQE